MIPTPRKFYPITKALLNLFANSHFKSLKKTLPKPPVPDLNTTLDRYLEYAQVVAKGQGFPLEQTKRAVDSFRKEGLDVQKKLVEFAEKSPNWVNAFWLPEMYLRVRLPLPVNSNPAYIFPHMKFDNVEQQIRYASLLVRGICDFKDKIDSKEIEREVSTGKLKVAMCMEQYQRILSCYRMPGEQEDIQYQREKRNKENEHVIAMCNNQAFVVHTRLSGSLLPYADIEHQLKEAVRRSAVRSGMAVPVGAASAGDRTTAAQFWKDMLEVDTNKKSLQWVKDAMFFVCLDIDGFTSGKLAATKEEQETELVKRGFHLLTGGGSKKHGFNRWYDATIQLVVSSDGTNGLCIEHSTAEGIVIIRMAENAIRFANKFFYSNFMAEKERQISSKPLTWHVSSAAGKLLEKQKETFDELVSELELQVLIFENFGKTFMKKCGVSPDGFVQLAMQLAHYKAHGYLVSTYESGSIRRFGGGRVDNVRAATPEALEWAQCMQHNSTSKQNKLELFRKAAEKQAKVTCQNITGDGIDNHLCGLSVVSRENQGNHEIFSDPLWSETLRFPLSTSQVSTSPDIPDTYLCYGAVVRDGYGCSYNLQDDQIIFAPSAFRSNERTNLGKFKAALGESLMEMKQLLT